MRWVAPVLGILLLVASVPPVQADSGIRLDPATTWVGLARVYLTVGDLVLCDGALEGPYEVRVPLSPASNDTGTIRLTLGPGVTRPAPGMVLHGSSSSHSGDAVNRVECHVLDDDQVRIRITTRRRTLLFKTHYRELAVPDGPR